MPLVTISDVQVFDLDEEALVGFQLDQPTTGSTSDVHSVELEGWVLGRDGRAGALQVSPGPGLDGILLPVGVPTPELGQAHPDLPWAGRRNGFRVAMSVLGMPLEFDLILSVLTKDGGKVAVARIRGTRKPAVPGAEADAGGMQPIMVTTMGRTGSQLVTNVLGTHPGVVIYPLGVMEAKIASYWADVFSALGGPRSYLQPVSSVIRGPRWWLGEATPHDEKVRDQPLVDWLGESQVGEVGRFCRERIDAFYERLVDSEEDGRPRYFAEKCVPKWPSYAQVLREVYPQTREIILVRDFRDVLCSVFSYNRRVGGNYFGRELAKSDEEYIRGFIANLARFLTSGWNERSDWAYLLRYEDLILQPEETLRSLLSYLEVSSDDDVMESLLEIVTQHSAQQAHGTSSSAQNSIGRWREELDPSLQAVCEDALGDALQTFGYSS